MAAFDPSHLAAHSNVSRGTMNLCAMHNESAFFLVQCRYPNDPIQTVPPRTASSSSRNAPRYYQQQSASHQVRISSLKSAFHAVRQLPRADAKSRRLTKFLPVLSDVSAHQVQECPSPFLPPSVHASSLSSEHRFSWPSGCSHSTTSSPSLVAANFSTKSTDTISAPATLQDAKADILGVIQDSNKPSKIETLPAITDTLVDPHTPRGSMTLHAADDVRERLESLVTFIIAKNPTEKPGPASLFLGQGVWEVFHAPHISRIANLLNIRFDPIRYTLRGTKIWSNVHYQLPFLGEGWLSASGNFSPNGDEAVDVMFDSFWWDAPPQNLRSEGPYTTGLSNDVVNVLGRLAFFPQFSTFPVLYVDEDMTVFQFSPLASNISARKVGTL